MGGWSRENATVVLYPKFRQRFKSPGLALPDRESRSPETFHRFTANVFQQFDGSRYILFERFPTLLLYQLMCHRVRANLILLCYFFYQFRIGFRYPAYNEKGGLGIGLLQNAKNAPHVFVDAHLIFAPVLLGASGIEVKKVDLFFNAESKYVHNTRVFYSNSKFQVL